WLVCINPYVEASPLYNKLDLEQGWDAEENRFAALTVLPYFQCPAYPHWPPISTLAPTHYIGLAGLGEDAATLPADDPRAGFFGYEREVVLKDLGDRSSMQLVAVETAQA